MSEENSSKVEPKLGSPIKAFVDLGMFPVLCVDTAQLNEAWKSPQPGIGSSVRKLVFKFNVIDSLTHNPSLTVYRAKPNGQYIGGAVITLDRRDLTFPITGEYLLGNLEILRTDFDKMSNTTKATHLLFFPLKSTLDNKSITYKLIWGNCNSIPDVAGLVANFELNPSPPANPQ